MPDYLDLRDVCECGHSRDDHDSYALECDHCSCSRFEIDVAETEASKEPNDA